MIVILVKYNCKPGMREAFFNVIREKGIDVASQSEEGNIRYEYSFSPIDENVMVLNEIWANAEVLEKHFNAPHFKELGELKNQYVESTELKKFNAEEA